MEGRAVIQPHGPILSVLVAVFDSARYLRDAVSSLAAQDLRDAELVFCDDASRDGSPDALAALLDEFSLADRSRILRHAENMGVSRTRQDLLDAAQGEFIVFLDPDDAVDPGMYAEMMSVQRTHGADFVWEGFFVEEGGAVSRQDEKIAEATAATLRRAILVGSMHGSVCNKLLCRAFVQKAGARFRDEVTCCEDMDFLMDVLAADPVTAYSAGCHYRYRRHPGSLSRGSAMCHLRSFERCVARWRTLFAGNEADLAAVEAFKRRFRLYAALDPSVPDAALNAYFPDVRSLGPGFPLGQRIFFFLAIRGMRPLLRCLMWYRNSSLGKITSILRGRGGRT